MRPVDVDRESCLCLCSGRSVDILTAATLCRLCFRHVDTSPITEISCLAAKSKQTKEFRCCRSTLGSGIRVAFLSPSEWNADDRNGAMSMILIFTGKGNRRYRILRYGKGFGLLDSMRYGLWLARGSA